MTGIKNAVTRSETTLLRHFLSLLTFTPALPHPKCSARRPSKLDSQVRDERLCPVGLLGRAPVVRAVASGVFRTRNRRSQSPLVSSGYGALPCARASSAFR